MTRWLTDASLLSGISVSCIPASCAAEDFELLKEYLSQFSGIQKVKVQLHSVVMGMKRFH
jgi:hypothetical protein